MFSKDGASTESVDMLYKAWRKTNPPNSSPEIISYGFPSDELKEEAIVPSGESFEVKANFVDPDSDPIKVEWQIVYESTDIKAGGDLECAPPAIPGLIKSKSGSEMIFKTPSKEGAYRVFISAYDGQNNMAYANIPFYVKPNPNKSDDVRLKKRILTFEF